MMETKEKTIAVNKMECKTIKGYVGALRRLDDTPEILKGYDGLSEEEKEVLTECRAHIAEVMDTMRNSKR